MRNVPNFEHFTHPQPGQREASFIEIQHGLACSLPYASPIIFLVHIFIVAFLQKATIEYSSEYVCVSVFCVSLFPCFRVFAR